MTRDDVVRIPFSQRSKVQMIQDEYRDRARRHDWTKRRTKTVLKRELRIAWLEQRIEYLRWENLPKPAKAARARRARARRHRATSRSTSDDDPGEAEPARGGRPHGGG